MNRTKRLTKRERKALNVPDTMISTTGATTTRATTTTTGTTTTRKAPAQSQAQHIHCIACGKHLEPEQFNPPATAAILQCQHGSSFPSCAECVPLAQHLLDEHDRNNKPLEPAPAWH